MRILLFSNLYAPEPTGVGPYSAELAEHLARQGHAVTVIAANPSYPHWRLQEGFRPWRWSRRQENGVDVRRVPVYIPARPSGPTRIVHYVGFVLAAMPVALRIALGRRPDLVILVAPTLLAAPLALASARLARARSWLHVQDFEVEAAFATDQMHASGIIARAALWFERRCIGAFDRTSSISPNMCAKLIEKGARDACELRNWADIDAITPSPSALSPLRERWNIRTTHVALYSGSIARKQGIDIIVKVAHRLRDRDITFVVCGNGPDRALLERSAADLGNIRFHDLQPRATLGDLLGLATIHLLPQKKDAADLVLPSKLTNMLASGKPVIATADHGTSLATEVEGCGLVVRPEDPVALAAAIVQLMTDPDGATAFGEEARRRAHARWSRSTILHRFDRELDRLADGNRTP